MPRNIDAVDSGSEKGVHGRSVSQRELRAQVVLTYPRASCHGVVGRPRIGRAEARTGRHTKMLLGLPRRDRAQGSGMKRRCTCRTAWLHEMARDGDRVPCRLGVRGARE